MDLGFYSYVFKRLAMIVAIVVGVCLLPGPRSLIGSQLSYLLAPASVASISYGIHLSLIHFCWLFGFELPSMEYPAGIEPQLTSGAIILSVACQLCVLFVLISVWRNSLHLYYLRQAALDEIQEFGDPRLQTLEEAAIEVVPHVGTDSKQPEATESQKTAQIDSKLSQKRAESLQAKRVDPNRKILVELRNSE